MIRPLSSLLFALTVAFLGTSIPSVAHAADEVPAMRTALLLLRALSYDRNLTKRAGKAPLTIVVVHRAGEVGRASNMLKALEAAAKKVTVAKMKVEVVRVPFSDDGRSIAKLGGSSFAALYLCPGLGEFLPAIMEVSRRDSILTFAETRADVEAGASIGIIASGSKPKLLVNLEAVEQEGANLDARFLGVVEVLQAEGF